LEKKERSGEKERSDVTKRNGSVKCEDESDLEIIKETLTERQKRYRNRVLREAEINQQEIGTEMGVNIKDQGKGDTEVGTERQKSYMRRTQRRQESTSGSRTGMEDVADNGDQRKDDTGVMTERQKRYERRGQWIQGRGEEEEEAEVSELRMITKNEEVQEQGQSQRELRYLRRVRMKEEAQELVQTQEEEDEEALGPDTKRASTSQDCLDRNLTQRERQYQKRVRLKEGIQEDDTQGGQLHKGTESLDKKAHKGWK